MISVRPKSSLRSTLIGSCILYVVDAFFFAQGIISLLVTASVALILLFSGLWALIRKQTDKWKTEAQKMTVVFVACLCVLGTIALNNQLAERRMLRLASACTQYKAKYQKYPGHLDDLVPDFMSSVPVAKYTLMPQWSIFIYFGASTSPVIGYYAMPPFGRRLYHVEKKTWGYMD